MTKRRRSVGTKWLELLKEIAPGVKRAAVIREAGTANGTGFFAAVQAVAPALGVELTPVGVRHGGEKPRPARRDRGLPGCC